ncbi:ferrochelatase [Comamonadaceae bacterium OS-1]|nr:ferrochelatase [Comamonadaceae bacterium OS-1]
MSLLASPFKPEPPFNHAQTARTGVLYCNLGTPDAATAAAVRPYLRQFLSDHRVIEIPKVIWNVILHGIILRTRPKQSAAKYASIWTPQGSPLRTGTAQQATLLQGWLGERGHRVQVDYAMRYGSPSIAEQLDKFKANGVTRVLIVPAYPQYSATSTASVFDAVYDWARQTRNIPELRFVNRYHDDPGYIAALARRIRSHWQQHGRPDQLVMSFHGVPARTLALGDPYHCECQKTARLLANALDLTKEQYKLTFQSRLGRAKWLEPYTEPSLIAMGKAGVQRVDVVCPGFTSDCLETLEEIAMEGKAAFLNAGGKEFHYIPCLNGEPDWITALSTLVQTHLQGWPTQAAPDAQALADTQARAKALGAVQ